LSIVSALTPVGVSWLLSLNKKPDACLSVEMFIFLNPIGKYLLLFQWFSYSAGKDLNAESRVHIEVRHALHARLLFAYFILLPRLVGFSFFEKVNISNVYLMVKSFVKIIDSREKSIITYRLSVPTDCLSPCWSTMWAKHCRNWHRGIKCVLFTKTGIRAG